MECSHFLFVFIKTKQLALLPPAKHNARPPALATLAMLGALRSTARVGSLGHRGISGVASLSGRNFLVISDLSQRELTGLLDLAHELKSAGKEETLPRPFLGKNIAMIFQKRSTRTRMSTESGMCKLGGSAIFLSSDDIQLGVNESLLDSARVMSRFSDLIMARVFDHAHVAELARESSVPVINALSDMYHPLQTLADYMTLQVRTRCGCYAADAAAACGRLAAADVPSHAAAGGGSSSGGLLAWVIASCLGAPAATAPLLVTPPSLLTRKQFACHHCDPLRVS